MCYCNSNSLSENWLLLLLTVWSARIFWVLVLIASVVGGLHYSGQPIKCNLCMSSFKQLYIIYFSLYLIISLSVSVCTFSQELWLCVQFRLISIINAVLFQFHCCLGFCITISTIKFTWFVHPIRKSWAD